MTKIVAIGGTGQLVAYHYLQLYLLGVIPDAFDVVVVDTDAIIGGIVRIQSFLDLLRVSEGDSSAIGAAIPTVSTLRIPAPEGNAFELLSGQKDVPAQHPAHAFFDRESAQQPLAQGLYARPALSAVVPRKQLSDALLMPSRESMTVAVGSIIGGTSGGLIAPTIDRMKSLTFDHEIKTRLRAVLFGQYFEPDEERGIQAIRLQSNELAVMKTLEESLDRLDLYRIIGGPDSPKGRRMTEKEKDKNMPWPEHEDHPVWDGVKALDFLLTDTVMPFRDRFEDREVASFNARFSLKDSRERLKSGLSVARALIKHRVLEKMAAEPFLGFLWGEKLPALISHYWRTAARSGGGWDRVQNFVSAVHGHMDSLWTGQGDEWGVSDVFPALTNIHSVKPGRVAEVKWPDVAIAPNFDRRVFVSADETAKRAAAVLLFWGLRTGV
jgi:hypothetical protein